jgi:hypothetical protein
MTLKVEGPATQRSVLDEDIVRKVPYPTLRGTIHRKNAKFL